MSWLQAMSAAWGWAEASIPSRGVQRGDGLPLLRGTSLPIPGSQAAPCSGLWGPKPADDGPTQRVNAAIGPGDPFSMAGGHPSLPAVSPCAAHCAATAWQARERGERGIAMAGATSHTTLGFLRLIAASVSRRSMDCQRCAVLPGCGGATVNVYDRNVRNP